MSISMKELLGSHNINDVPHSVQLRLEELRTVLNQVRNKRGVPMIITRGYANKADQERVYGAINARRAKKGLPPLKIPTLSRHETGEAADVYDPDGSWYAWCEANEDFLTKVGIWMEVKDDEPRVHMQIVPPRSGRRFFNP